MAWKSAERPGSERPKTAANVGREQRVEAPAPAERYGPLIIDRRVKDDGRALILYTFSEEELE
jgi:hypothetical protein